MVVTEQIRCVESQSQQAPMLTQGVSTPKLLALIGAAISWARFRADSRSGVTLLIPATLITFLGPKIMALVRFPAASILTISPVAEIALALQKKQSHLPWRSRIARDSSRFNPSCQ
jgi:hypothetical protein